MVYKICFVSTHGTGKTALAALTEGELKRRDINAKYISEMATSAIERGLPINEGTTIEAQLWILYQQFAEELVYSGKRSTSSNYEVIICDRGPDNYCYLERRVGEHSHALSVTLGHLEHFPYNQIYLIPIIEERIAPGEGIRSINPEFQQEMDTHIRQFLAKHKIAFHELPRPHNDDNYRNEWVKIIVNQTLQDLDKPEHLYMR